VREKKKRREKKKKKEKIKAAKNRTEKRISVRLTEENWQKLGGFSEAFSFTESDSAAVAPHSSQPD
jgi:hypothetical protein